jgi:hypothetical protein
MVSDLYEIIFLTTSWVIMEYLALIIQIYISEYTSNQKIISFEASLLICWLFKWEPNVC